MPNGIRGDRAPALPPGWRNDTFTDWEFSAGTDSYEEAAVPAQVGRRVIEGLFDAVTLGKDLSAHVTFGLGVGMAFRAVTATLRRSLSASATV